MCKAAAIRVWDYDCGANYDSTDTPFDELKLAELQARWGDPCGISGAEAVCLNLRAADHELACARYARNARPIDWDEELPF